MEYKGFYSIREGWGMLAKALHKEVLVETFILVETQTLVSAASWGLVAPCLWPFQPQWWVVSWRSRPEPLAEWGVLYRVPRWHTLWRRLLCWYGLCGCDCPISTLKGINISLWTQGVYTPCLSFLYGSDQGHSWNPASSSSSSFSSSSFRSSRMRRSRSSRRLPWLRPVATMELLLM